VKRRVEDGGGTEGVRVRLAGVGQMVQSGEGEIRHKPKFSKKPSGETIPAPPPNTLPPAATHSNLITPTLKHPPPYLMG